MDIDKRRKGVLILECDSTKLEQQGLALGADLHIQTRAFLPRNPIRLVQSRTQSALLEELADVLDSKVSYKTVVLIGHSNAGGLQVASDVFVDWVAVGRFLSPFAPRRLVLLACEAAQEEPCDRLFDTIETLDEIFGSPVPAHKNQQYIVMGKIVHVLFAKKENRQVNQLMQLGNLFVTGGVMFHRSRTQYIY